MTHHPIRTEPDGTRVYSAGQRYKPKAAADRVYGVNKPDDPRAVRFHALWFLPLELVDDQARVMPETIPDDETLLHPAWCRCRVCTRPQAAAVWARERRRRPQSRSRT